ncbi:MAG: hypothetical protein LBH69_02255 [Methanomassiliicoccaceae archaeon]|jgi:PDZ domain-containing secreted protein|nr:hypothetical protein [Methanomassiliicoccaceae archaeon]
MSKETKKKIHTSKITDVYAKDVKSVRSVNVLIVDDELDYLDDDPITQEEEKDLRISMNEFKNGKAIHIPGSYTDEEFFKVLRE